MYIILEGFLDKSIVYSIETKTHYLTWLFKCLLQTW
jgi:hypothetical protein